MLAEFLDIMSSEWAIRALVASSLVGVMCGILGCFIVLRNMSLIGDALSHAVLPGIFVAFILMGYSTLGFFLGSTAAGLLTAFIISWVQQKGYTKNDAVIGIIFTAMFSLGVMGISWLNQSEGVHLDLTDFLFGNVLGISDEDIILTSGICIYTVLSVIVFYRYLFITTFQPTIAQTMGISVKAVHYFLMLLLSFAIVASLRSVGVILVVAMLITPAATALLLSDKLKIVICLSAVIGVLSAISGLILAILLETTPGPAMTVVATIFYFLALVFSPSKGLFVKMLTNRHEKFRILTEDVLRQVVKKPAHKGMRATDIAVALGIGPGKLRQVTASMQKMQLVSVEEDKVRLTETGLAKATALVRAHRLWETYQVRTMGLSSDQIHDEADQLEHHLSEDLIDEIDKTLGFPRKDPHDSPIPGKEPGD